MCLSMQKSRSWRTCSFLNRNSKSYTWPSAQTSSSMVILVVSTFISSVCPGNGFMTRLGAWYPVIRKRASAGIDLRQLSNWLTLPFYTTLWSWEIWLPKFVATLIFFFIMFAKSFASFMSEWQSVGESLVNRLLSASSSTAEIPWLLNRRQI